MTEPYFNGTSIEEFFEYSNQLVEGMFANAFLVTVWIVMVYVLSKSEWKVANGMTYAFFVTLLLGIVMKLFMTVSDYLLFILAVGLAGSLFWSIISGDR